MAGTVLRLFPKQLIDFSKMAASSSHSWNLADFIDVSGWKEAQLIARVHPGTSIASGTNANLNLVGIYPHPQDPAQGYYFGTITNGSIVFDSANNVADGSNQ